MNGINLIIASVLLRALNPILFKAGAIRIESFTLMELLTNIFYLLGFLTLFIRTLVWQKTLKQYQLSYAYPFLSLAFILILGAGYFLFNEAVSINNVIGTFIIILGVLVMNLKQKSLLSG